MIVTHKVKLDLAKWELPPRIDVMQGDKYSRNLELHLYENGIPFAPSEISNVLVRYVKPDRTGGEYDTLPDGSTAWSIHEDALVIAIAPQVCTVPGIAQVVVCLCSGDAELNSFLLELQVQKLPKGICASHPYVNITGFVPQPDSAQVGQYLKVKEVDPWGKVTAVETTESSGSAVIPENVVTCDLDGSTVDESTTALNADTLGGRLPNSFAPAATYCILHFPSDFSCSATYTSWPMAIESQSGDFFEINSDGNLVCIKSCCAEISGQVYVYNAFTANDVLYIGTFKNESCVGRVHYMVSVANPYETCQLCTSIVSLAEGDVISLRIQNTKGARGLIKNYNVTSRMIVKLLSEGGLE